MVIQHTKMESGVFAYTNLSSKDLAQFSNANIST